MAYIDETDILGSLDKADIETVKRDDQSTSGSLIEATINTTCRFIRERLGGLFDIDAELSKTGQDRNATLVECAVDIAVWKLCKPFETITQDGKKYQLFQDALKTLDRIAGGTINIGLTRLVDERTTTVKYGQTNIDIEY